MVRVVVGVVSVFQERNQVRGSGVVVICCSEKPKRVRKRE